MIHPSYSELMEKVNKEQNEEAKIKSRYSIVLATSKRARQLTDGSPTRIDNPSDRILSTAIEEFYEGKVHISENEYKEETVEETIIEESTEENA